MSRRRFLFFASVILLAAALVRLVDLASIPPGLHFDEAVNGIIARGIAFEGDHPLFIAAFTGKETLWFYLAAGVMRLGGPGAFSLRLTSAWIGLATVGITGWLVRQLYQGDERRDWLALLALAVLAISFWHGVLSRLAFRAISQPLMQALSIGLLWLGLRSQRWWWLALAGLATGLAAYTYLAVRLFPLPLALALVVYVIAARSELRASLRALTVYGGSALLAFAPLGVYFWQHPESFGARIAQVAPAEAKSAWEGVRLALGMFFLKGDPLWRFNLPGKPIFGPILAVFFVTGLGVAIRDALANRDPLDRALGALLIGWPLVMLMPTALAIGGITPSNLRAVGLIPVIAIYPALGIVWTIKAVDDLRTKSAIPRRAGRRRMMPMTSAAALAALFIAGLGTTIRDTLRWGQSTTLYYDNDGHVAALADYLNEEAQGSIIYVTTQHLHHPTLAFFAADFESMRSLYGGHALAVAPEGGSLMVYTRDVLPPPAWRAVLEERLIAAPDGPDGTPDFYVYYLPASFDFGWEAIPGANFGNIIALESADMHGGQSGNEAVLDIGWQILNSADQPDYAIVAEVCDAWDWCWLKVTPDGALERGRNNSFASTQWAAGERLFTRLSIPLPPAMPPGEYTVRVSIFSSAGDSRLAILDASGGFAGQTIALSGLDIARDPAPDPGSLAIQYPLNTTATPGLDLLGYDQPVTTARQGEMIPLALHWQRTLAPFSGDGLITITLDDGTLLYDDLPVHDTYPVSAWQTGELVTDRYQLWMPAEQPAGTYRIILRVDDNKPLELGALTIEATNRVFEFPEDIQLLGETPTFGNQIALIGHDELTWIQPGDSVDLRLIWIAAAMPDQRYSVFIHIVDELGSTIVAQYDGPPLRDGEPYPTALWVPGEVVDGIYTLHMPSDISPGLYHFRVGFYLPENGSRLTLPGSADNAFTLPDYIQIGAP